MLEFKARYSINKLSTLFLNIQFLLNKIYKKSVYNELIKIKKNINCKEGLFAVKENKNLETLNV